MYIYTRARNVFVRTRFRACNYCIILFNNRSGEFFAMTFAESTDVENAPQLAIVVRGVNSNF
jgi:hypothetical protein